MDASEFDRMFDDGEDVTEHLDLMQVRWPALEPREAGLAGAGEGLGGEHRAACADDTGSDQALDLGR